MRKTFDVVHCGDDEIIIVPSPTPNPDQWRLGLRTAVSQVSMRRSEVKELIAVLQKHCKET